MRRINPVVTRIPVELRDKLAPFYSGIGRPSIDPELMIRMPVTLYCALLLMWALRILAAAWDILAVERKLALDEKKPD